MTKTGAFTLYFGFTNGNGAIWLDNVDCIGNEARLIDCNHRPIGSHSCGHFSDVSVGCTLLPSEHEIHLPVTINKFMGKLIKF